MTVPQRLTASKTILLLLLPVFSASAIPALGQQSTDADRRTLFVCTTDEVDDVGYLDLNGIPHDDGTWSNLRFERHADGDGKLIYAFPPGGVDGKTAFLFSHSDGPDGYLVSIRWADEGRDYVYYSLVIPPDPEVEDDAGGGAAGLAIGKDGKLIERIGCDERPSMFISYVREAMSCDTANPYGEAACGEDPHERAEDLDPEAIGIVP